MPKKKTGEALHWATTKNSWTGRVRGYPEGCARGRWLTLGTPDKAIAQQRYDRWLLTGEPPKEATAESFEEAATRVTEQRVPEGKKKRDRLVRLRSYVFPFIGRMEASTVAAKNVASVLDRMPALGKKKGTIAYVRTDMSQVFLGLIREGSREDNPAADLPLPADAVEDGRLRQVLTDDEIIRFREHRGCETELDLACWLARDVAGHRTSDLLAARYEHFDFVRGTLKVRRPKTDTEGKFVNTRRVKSYELVTHVLPPGALEVVTAWWVKKGRPASGPLFTIQKPSRAGVVTRKDGSQYTRKASQAGDALSRNGTSFAPALRRALWEAGIVRPLPGWDPANPQKDFCALQTDTDESRRADFHSMRRAFVTAMKGAGASTLDVLAAAGHTQEATSSRYDAARLIHIPDAALPRSRGFVAPAPPDGHPLASPSGTFSNVGAPFDVAALFAQIESMKAALLSASASVPEVPKSVPKGGNDLDSRSYSLAVGSGMVGKSSESLVEPTGIEPVAYALRMGQEPLMGSQVPEMSEADRAHATPAEDRLSAAEASLTQSLGRLIAEAAAAGDWAHVEELTALARRRSAPPPANVRSLAEARKRRG